MRSELEMARARRYERTLTLALCGIDEFKRVNDEYGHLTGDEVLKDLAARMRTIAHPDTILGRLGGDEFALVLPGSTIEDAKELVTPLRAMAVTRLSTRYA
jgi:diguanylate cyclase (GGDEF)-like protein